MSSIVKETQQQQQQAAAKEENEGEMKKKEYANLVGGHETIYRICITHYKPYYYRLHCYFKVNCKKVQKCKKKKTIHREQTKLNTDSFSVFCHSP